MYKNPRTTNRIPVSLENRDSNTNKFERIIVFREIVFLCKTYNESRPKKRNKTSQKKIRFR